MNFNYSNSPTEKESIFPRSPQGNVSRSAYQAKQRLSFTYNPIPSRPNFWSQSSFQLAFIQLIIKLLVQLFSQQYLKPEPNPEPDVRPVYGVATPDLPQVQPVYGIAVPDEFK